MKKYVQVIIRELKRRHLKKSLLEEGLTQSSRNKFISEGVLVEIARVRMPPTIPNGWGADVFSNKIEDSARVYNAIINNAKKDGKGLYIREGFDEDFKEYMEQIKGAQ